MQRSSSGFTRIELLVVILAGAVLVTMLAMNIRQSRQKSIRIKCISNHKQGALALKIFASDHRDRFPYQVDPPISITTPHTAQQLINSSISDVTNHATWAHWAVISNCLGSPKVLLCPGNRAKHYSIAVDFTATPGHGYFAEEGLKQMSKVNHSMDRIDYERKIGYDLSGSYFISLSANEKIPAGILMGDANINWTPFMPGKRANPASAGIQVLHSPDHFANFRFVRGRDHPRYYDHHNGAGNVALTDGSVAQVDNNQLKELIADTTNALGTTNLWLVIPR